MLAIGVGGADAVDALTGTPWELKAPQVIGSLIRSRITVITLNQAPRRPFDWETQRLGHPEGSHSSLGRQTHCSG